MASARLETLKGTASRYTHSEWAVLAPFCVFCFVYPFAMLLLSLDLMPFGMEWMSSLLLAMLGLSVGAWLWLNFGSRGAMLAAAIFVIGLALEYVGVATGLPFGRYSYTGVLVPGLPGGVPLAIGFAWLFIIGAGLFTAHLLLRARPTGRNGLLLMSQAALGALLAVGLDLLLEPVAFHVKRYWIWLDEPAGYYGVPWLNFAAWLVAALLMNLLVLQVVKTDVTRNLHMRRVPAALYFMNVALFGVVNIAHGILIPGVVCLLLAAGAFLLLRPRTTPGGI